MRTFGREFAKTAGVILGAAAMIGGAVGWAIGELISRHDPRRRYP